MFLDPIVQEVRKAGEELADEANGDVKQFFANLRKAQGEYKDRLVDAVSKKTPGDLSSVNESKAWETHMNHQA